MKEKIAIILTKVIKASFLRVLVFVQNILQKYKISLIFYINGILTHYSVRCKRNEKTKQ